MVEKGLVTIIMAGGMGKRMNSNIPKVLHMVNDKPMLLKVIEVAVSMNSEKIFVVVGLFKEEIIRTLTRYIDISKICFVEQKEALGTGHAILCSLPYLKDYRENKDVLILSGDVPLINKSSLKILLDNKDLACLITTEYEEPSGYGRIILDDEGKFSSIIEEKDCNESERLVKKVNTGVYLFDVSTLFRYLPRINNNNKQNEYYLTDIFKIIYSEENNIISAVEIPRDMQYQFKGVNTVEQLLEVENEEEKLR
jgi:UDP-N-acetylglucosamine diphosphorylase/glucosamine-1-phosphate N-acetyltransferase